jgi:hypothetical protein
MGFRAEYASSIQDATAPAGPHWEEELEAFPLSAASNNASAPPPAPSPRASMDLARRARLRDELASAVAQELLTGQALGLDAVMGAVKGGGPAGLERWAMGGGMRGAAVSPSGSSLE